MTDLRILKLQASRQLKQDLAKANLYFQKNFPLPTLNYALRGAKAGVAYLQQNEIRLNPTLLQENGTAFIQQVVPHELAHLLVYHLLVTWKKMLTRKWSWNKYSTYLPRFIIALILQMLQSTMLINVVAKRINSLPDGTMPLFISNEATSAKNAKNHSI